MNGTYEAFQNEPEALGFLALMRLLERADPDKPRIGQSATLAEDIVTLHQDAFMEFPSLAVSEFLPQGEKAPKVTTRFMGYFGPQGALPLNTTEEVRRWVRDGDDAFVEFANLFATRFLQLFYRTWADARRIAQHDRPDEDRFKFYLECFMGYAPGQNGAQNPMSEFIKLPYCGVVATRVKSTKRLKHLLEGLLEIPVKISEHEPSWLDFGSDDISRLGEQACQLGINLTLGSRSQTISDKIKIEFETQSLEDYLEFVPSGQKYQQLSGLVSSILGMTIEAEIAPTLPGTEVRGVKLGALGHTGWSSWLGKTDKSCNDQVSGASYSIP